MSAIIGSSASKFRVLLRRRRVVTCDRRISGAAVLPSRHVAFGAGAEHESEAEQGEKPQHGDAAVA
jgi:hypothetical protein